MTTSNGMFERGRNVHTPFELPSQASTTYNNGDNSTVTALWTYQEAIDNATTSCASGREPSANRHANIDWSSITYREHSFLQVADTKTQSRIRDGRCRAGDEHQRGGEVPRAQ